MLLLKGIHSKCFFHAGLYAARAARWELAARLMEKSSAIISEVVSSGGERYQSHYARTQLNLGVMYYRLGEREESLHAFLISIRKFTVLVRTGRLDLADDLAKAEAVFQQLYPGAVIDLQRGVIVG